MASEALWRLDASALSQRIAARDVTPTAVIEELIARHDRLEPILNAFVTFDMDGVRRAAAASTARQSAGTLLGPLDGIPVSIKDNLWVRDLPARWGSLMYRDFVPDEDDIPVARLRAAGAVIVGKTTTPEFAMMQRTQSRLSGVTRNPWDLALTAGGSSGGAVAAVSAGLGPLAIGTDAGGSTRVPAGYTGLLGLRPSNGRVPRRHGFPPMALDFQAIGLICRTIADLDLLLAAVAGPDPRDPASLDLGDPAPPAGPLRIGWFTAIGDETADAAVIETHRLARERLAALGHHVHKCAPPFDIAALRSVWDMIALVGVARAVDALGDRAGDATDQIAAMAAAGRAIAATDYVRALDRLQDFRADTSAGWGALDALLVPTTPAPAWPAERECPETIGGRSGSGATQGMFCGWVNAMGYAALNVPGQPHPDGRPIGVQIVAPRGNDAVVIDIGRQLERAIPWRDRWPAVAQEILV